MSETRIARTYNQNHAPRKYSRDRRRVSMYVAWSYPAEAGRNPSELDNRFSTMTEVRRVAWPAYEAPEWSDPFQQFVGETTGHGLPVFQRIDQAGFKLPLDERVLADADTLFVFGLDHMITEQAAAPEEIEAVRLFLRREGTCLVLGPHHEVGVSDDPKVRDME